jgi:hypothetical protein
MAQMIEEDPWKKQVTKELGLTGEVQWILRMGYLKSYPDRSVYGCPFHRLFRIERISR